MLESEILNLKQRRRNLEELHRAILLLRSNAVSPWSTTDVEIYQQIKEYLKAVIEGKK